MNIGIVGAGVAGLHAAYHLAKEDGHQVTLYEKANFIGGLAHYYPIDGTYLEKFYHFIMTADVEYLDFLEKLGVLDRLNWVETHTSFYANGKMYDFTGPVDLLKFGDIPFTSRLRFAFTMAYLTKVASNWRKLEKSLAHEWLKRWCGRKAWDSIWESNLRMKFGSYVEELTMPWIWARARMVNQYRDQKSGSMSKEKRAWIKGSTKTFLDAAEKALTDLGVKVRVGVDIEEIVRANGDSGPVVGVRVAGEEMTPHDRVLYCAPSYVLHSMLKGIDGDPYFEMIREQRYFGVVCAVLALDRNLTSDFWVYANDPRVPFVGVINYSPFLDYEDHQGHHVIYIPAYGDPDQYPYTETDENLFKKYCDGLKVIWPEFDESWIREKRIFRVPNASLRVTGEYSKKIPAIKSPIENFFFANLSQIYPQDRGISISMKLADYARTAVRENRDVEMNFTPY
jgi:protoporphyrinogen oxidase